MALKITKKLKIRLTFLGKSSQELGGVALSPVLCLWTHRNCIEIVLEIKRIEALDKLVLVEVLKSFAVENGSVSVPTSIVQVFAASKIDKP